MPTSNESPRRLLVALDNAGPCQPALETLIRLLPAAPVELTGLFVEDEDLLRAAALPGLREVLLSGQSSQLDTDKLGRELANAAAGARQAFETLAAHLAVERQGLKHRFRVARGRIADEFGHAAAEHDMVVVARSVRATGLRPRAGRAFLALAHQPSALLFVNEPWRSGTSVVVLDGDADAVRYAARIAELEAVRLVVAQPPDAPRSVLPAGAIGRALADMAEESVARLCQAEDARLLVLPPRQDMDWAELLVSLVDKLPCSLLKLGAAG